MLLKLGDDKVKIRASAVGKELSYQQRFYLARGDLCFIR